MESFSFRYMLQLSQNQQDWDLLQNNTRKESQGTRGQDETRQLIIIQTG